MHNQMTASTARNSYEGVDSLDRFTSAAELVEYRRGLLARTEVEVNFIKREVGRRNLRVVDLGTGSGRLPIALALAGIAQSATGMDISRSRIEFARRWANDLGLENIEFTAANVLDWDAWPAGEVDLFLCITNLLGYLGPVHPDAPADVLRRAYRSLAPDGCLVLEGYQLTTRHRRILAANDNRLRTWMPLPEWDRFAYYLSDITYDSASGVLTHEKTFIGRDGSIDAGRVEENTFYTRDEILGWLRQEGCSRYRAFRNYASEPYTNQSTQLVLVLGAPHWRPRTEAERNAVPALTGPVFGVGVGAWN